MKEYAKSIIAAFVCIFLLINTPFSPIPFIGMSVVCVLILTFTGVVESPRKTRSRKWKAADDALAEKERYESLSEEGKLLYEMNERKKQQSKRLTDLLLILCIFAATAAVIFFMYLNFQK